MTIFQRQPNETPEAWLQRLRATSDELTPDEQISWWDHMQAAQSAIHEARGDFDAAELRTRLAPGLGLWAGDTLVSLEEMKACIAELQKGRPSKGEDK